MSKERLEEIINDVNESDKSQLDKILKKKFKDYTLEDYVFLHEQAERVQELENTLRIWMDRSDHLSGEYLKFKDKNKYYRGVLGFYADKENYKPFGDILRGHIVVMIHQDSGLKAREALESESE